jgi:predicted protein tyrosine phosphatase
MITILNHREAAEAAWNRPVIIISDPDSETQSIRYIKARASKYLHMEFLDVDGPTGTESDKFIPNSKDITKIVNWYLHNVNEQDHDKLIVACYAGISRSAAVAYGLQWLHTGNAKESIKILDQDRHWPNTLIVSMFSYMDDQVNVEAVKYLIRTAIHQNRNSPYA